MHAQHESPNEPYTIKSLTSSLPEYSSLRLTIIWAIQSTFSNPFRAHDDPYPLYGFCTEKLQHISFTVRLYEALFAPRRGVLHKIVQASTPRRST